MFRLQNGIEMPKLSLGTYLAKGAELHAAVDNALQVGYRGFDTAKFYENEKDLGDALKILLPKHGLETKDIFLTTKVFPIASSNAYELITKDINESLEFLGRDYLDLVLVHYPRPLSTGDQDQRNATYRKETWMALEKLHSDGKIRSIGVSNYEISHIEEMRHYLTFEPHVNQVEYHPHFQRKGLREYCQKHNILFQAFSPFGRGNQTLLSDETLVRIANNHHTTPAVIILAWIMQGNNGVVAKSSDRGRIAANYKAGIMMLTEDEFEQLNALDLETPYVEDRGWEVI